MYALVERQGLSGALTHDLQMACWHRQLTDGRELDQLTGPSRVRSIHLERSAFMVAEA